MKTTRTLSRRTRSEYLPTVSLAWLALLALPATPLLAGGTPATGTTSDQLIMMGGAQSAASTGDYISASDGLNSPFYFYIEVPAGQTDLQIDLFDADVLVNALEEALERDRDRSSERTSVRYQLYDPAGNLMPTRMNYGDNVSPPNADGAWKAFYNNKSAGITGGDTFRDEFTTAAYTNNDGTQTFAGNWVEANDLGGGGATGGDVQVTGGVLRIANSSDPSPFVNQPRVAREVNLSGYTNALVSFDYASGAGVDLLETAGGISGDSIAFEASSDGGTTYFVLEEFADILGTVTGSRVYDVTDYISGNTRFRFRITMRYAAVNEYFDVDNFQVRATTSANGANPANGHWRLVVDMSNRVNADQDRNSSLRDDVNGFGIRAHDGTPGSGGTEFNLYAETFTIIGINRTNSQRTYQYYPWVSAGCAVQTHDFDYDADLPPEGPPNPNVSPYGAWSLASRTGSFTANSTTMSDNNVWRSQNVTNWTTQAQALDYGIWDWDLRIEDNGPANYAPFYITYDPDGGEPPPSSNPENGAFRIYFPSDAGGPPVKPYLTQQLTHFNNLGPNPPVVGQTTRYAVTVTVHNPTGAVGDLTFSSTNVVTANVPGGAVVYAGASFMSQGSIVSQPAIAGSGDVTWNPGTVSSGTIATLVYMVDVTPVAPGDLPATGVFDTGAGTRATYVDGTGNTTQARATHTLGELCGLVVDADTPTPAVIASFQSRPSAQGSLLEWRTAAEAGTVAFEVWRQDGERATKLHEATLFAQLDAPQGGTYRFLDRDASGGERTYWLIEVASDGRRSTYGPYVVADQGPTVHAKGEFESRRLPADPLDAARRQAARDVDVASAMTVAAGIDARLRIEVVEPGFYRLSAAELASAFGLPLRKASERIANHGFALELDGQPVAWTSRTGDALEFWGEPSESPFHRENVYRLTLGPGLAIASRAPLYPQQLRGSDVTRETWRQERDLRPVVLLSLDPESDIFFWDFLQAGANASKSFALQVPDLAARGTAAQLHLDLQGAAAGQHVVQVAVNGQSVGSVQVGGLESVRRSVAVPGNALVEGANTVQLTLVGGSLVFVDGFDLAYDRQYRPTADALIGRASGSRFGSAWGFQSADVRVYDLTNPRRPLRVERMVTTPEAGAFRAIFEQSRVAGTRFVAVGAQGYRTPARITPDTPAPIAASAVDLLLVAPPGLLAAAEAYAAERSAAGVESRVIALEDVYDEYASGQRDPRALRTFLAAAGQWPQPPRAVLLVGNGSYDYRNVLGHGDNLLPTLLVDRGGSLFPSDAAYAGVDAGGAPRMTVGRIPVLTAAELEAYGVKVAAYEASGGAAWQSEVLMLADVPATGKNFAAESGLLAGLVAQGFATSTIDLQTAGLSGARQQLFAALAAGKGWINFVGHGGVDRLAPQGLLTKADAAGLTNGERLPIVSAVSCHIALHGLPGFDSLGEDLVLTPAGGAVAVFAPAWLSEHDEARVLGDRLFRGVFRTEVPSTLGEATQRALREAAAAGVPWRLLSAYQLLGDPSLLLQLAPAPAPVGPGCAPDCGQG
jgi:hypothetical protein